MRTSLHLGSIAGIRIDVNFSWLIIFALLTFTLATGVFPGAALGYSTLSYWVAAVIAVLLFFASVLAHELAHSLVARSFGMPVKSITLFIFGGVSNIEREPQSAGDEFKMAFVGPFTSLVIGAALLLFSFLLGNVAAMPSLIVMVVFYLGFANVVIGIFNLIPGFPMDGGRVLRAAIWQATGSLERATRWAANIGQGVAYLMMLIGVWLFFVGYTLDGLWVGFIGLFLLQASQAELMQTQLQSSVEGVSVGEMMTEAPSAVIPTLSVQQLVDEYLLRTGQRATPVIDDFESQRLIGIVTLRDVRALDRRMWPFTPVVQIMTPLAQLKIVRANQLLSEALPLITAAGVNQLPVVSDGRIVGLLGLEAIVERLQTRRALGLETSAATPAASREPRTPSDTGATGVSTDTRLPTPS